MSLLDRYIARQYLINIAILLILLFSFVVFVDVSINIDRLLRLAAESPEHPEGFRKVLIALMLAIDLWWPRLLQLFNYVNGLVLVGAMGFTYTQLVRTRELVAAIAGGVSLFRLARPVLVVAFIMLGLQLVNQEFVIPRIAHLLARDNNQAGVRTLATFNVRLTPDDKNRVIMARSFDPTTKTMTGLYVLERDTTGAAKRKLVAESATWTGNLWNLTGGYVRPAGVAARSENDPRVARAEPVKALQTNIDPTTLLANHYRSFSTSLSWRQINEVLSTPGLTPQVREQMSRIGWGRVSMLLSTILSLIIAMPFFLRKEPTNMAVQSLKCAPVAIGCLLGGVLGASLPLPASLLAPGVAVFLPIIVLLPLSIAMVSGVRS